MRPHSSRIGRKDVTTPMRTRLIVLGVALLVAAMLPASALAAPSTQSAPGESNLGFLFAGLAIAWAGFFAYAIYTSIKTRELRREIEELRQQLAERPRQ